MRSPGKLMLSLSSFKPDRTRVAAIAQQRSDAQLLDQMSRGIGYFMGESEDAAGTLAQAAMGQRQRVRSKDAQASQVLPLAQARRDLQAALARGSCLLALPFNVIALDLLRELAGDQQMNLLLVESPAVRVLLDEFSLSASTLRRCPTQDVVRHVKAGIGARPVIYISFPELHTLAHGTTAPVSFLDKPCRFALLEPLLCMYGLDTLVTIGNAPGAAGAGLQLVAWDAAAARALHRGKSILMALEWLFGHLQAAARAMPTTTFSWPQLYRASLHCYQIERGNLLKQLEAYFEAWRRSPAGLSEHTHRLALARIGALRDAT